MNRACLPGGQTGRRHKLARPFLHTKGVSSSRRKPCASPTSKGIIGRTPPSLYDQTEMARRRVSFSTARKRRREAMGEASAHPDADFPSFPFSSSPILILFHFIVSFVHLQTSTCSYHLLAMSSAVGDEILLARWT